tara:strand:+ start:169 stop:2094 length:1926 start_codon:yes stop_codon:yes gene_type:complete
MCGIAGIHNSGANLDELKNIAYKTIDLLHHRGPDDNGFEIFHQDNSKQTLFVHTRLSILDLSSAGNQPMSDTSGNYWISFNGEIYNFLEIKKELLELGIKFKSNTDTEVILESYKIWGLKAFENFVGMWSLAIWDKKKDELLLSRDRLGVKPLYYTNHNESIFFGSEPKAIINFLPGKRKLNPNALTDYFSFRQVLGEETFFSDVFSLEPGNHLIIKNGKIRKIKYWDLPIVDLKNDFSEQELKEELGELLSSSVKYRMISDVPLGSFLSGGLDSSILVYNMSKFTDRPIKTYTIGFDGEGYNEFSYATEVSKFLGTDHKQEILSAEDYLNLLSKMIEYKDSPLAVPNEIALHKLSKSLKEDITVVLSGEGADELFGGYGRIFRSAYDFQRLDSGNLNEELLDNLNIKYKSLTFKKDLDHFLDQYSYISTFDQKKLFREEVLNKISNGLNNRNFIFPLWNRLDNLSYLDKMIWFFQKIHLQGLLNRLDTASMSASVEARVPFVDHRLIEFFNKVPSEYKIKWINEESKLKASNLNSDQISENLDITKYVLRENYKKNLPSSISSRKKVGFPVPLNNWLSGPLKNYAQEKLLGDSSRTQVIFKRSGVEEALKDVGQNVKSGLKVWMMLNLEEWMNIYDINSP